MTEIKIEDGVLIPAIVQDWQTQKVLMLGYMNDDALRQTLKEGKVTFFSRSKNRLWTKGETSGNFLHLKGVKQDCDQDTLLIQAQPTGPVCHNGTDTCFDEVNEPQDFMEVLERIIISRKENPAEGSYTTSLFKSGIKKITQKVGEEAVELTIEALGNDRDLFLNEAADLMYHFMVLLAEKGVRLEDVKKVLEGRQK